MERYPGYQTYETCGVDVRQFFNDMGTSILAVSKSTGLARQTVSGFPVNYVNSNTAGIVISYLEDKNIKEYQSTIMKCSEEIEKIKVPIQQAWEIYLHREKMLDEYRKKYGIKKRNVVEQVSVKDVFEKQY